MENERTTSKISPSGTVLFVGLGSAHGDDQIGWQVSQALASQNTAEFGIAIRKAASPSDILDWIAEIERLHVVDACVAADPIGTVHRFEYDRSPGDNQKVLPELQRLRSNSTHQLSLAAALDLAATLGQLPSQVVVHAVCGRNFQPGAAVSSTLEEKLPEIATSIWSELTNARRIPGAVVARSG